MIKEGMARSALGLHLQQPNDTEDYPAKRQRTSSAASDHSTTTYYVESGTDDFDDDDTDTYASLGDTDADGIPNWIPDIGLGPNQQNDDQRTASQPNQLTTFSTAAPTIEQLLFELKKLQQQNQKLKKEVDSLKKKTCKNCTKAPSTQEFDADTQARLVRLMDACINKAFAHIPGFKPPKPTKPAFSPKKKTTGERPPPPKQQSQASIQQSSQLNQQPPQQQQMPAVAHSSHQVPPSYASAAGSLNTITVDSAPDRTQPIANNEKEWQQMLSKKDRKRLRRIQQEQLQQQQQLPPRLQKTTPQPTAALWRKPVKKNTVLIVPATAGKSVLTELEAKPELDPRKLNVQHRRIYQSGAMLVTCATPEDATLLKGAIKNVPSLAIRESRPKLPEIRIHHVQKDAKEEDIRYSLQRDFGEEPTEVTFVNYKEPNRIPETKLVVCTVKPETYEKASHRKTIRILWRHCNLATEARLTRCSNCGILGHPEKYCPYKKKEGDTKPALPLPKVAAHECIDCAAYNLRLPKHLAASLRRPLDHARTGTSCPTRAFYIRKLLPTKPQEESPATSAEDIQTPEVAAAASNAANNTGGVGSMETEDGSVA